MKVKNLFFLLFLVLPTIIFSQETFNIGLVNGLWFSNDKIFAGDQIFVNTIFYNDSKTDVSGLVIFYDNKESFFEQKVIVKKNNLEHIKAPYKAVSGEHEFEAKIMNAKKIENGKETEEVETKNGFLLGNEKIFVDFDTDNDGIGNKEDNDDDGDGYSDKKEIEEGSDPLDKLSIPKNNIEQDNIKKVIKEVKTASDNILTRAEAFRINTANIIEQKIQTLKQTEIKNSENLSLKSKIIDGKIIIKDDTSENNKETKTNFYLI